MKIGIVCPYNIFRPGGVQSCVLAHYEELRKRGHDVRIIAPKPKEVPENFDENIILIAQSTEVNTPFHTMVDIALRVDQEEIAAMLDQEKFDILHFHEPWIPRMPLEVLAQSSARNIATFHAKLPESFWNKSFEKAIAPYAKQFFKNLDYLTAVSDAAASYVRSLTNGTPIEIIPNAIDQEIFRSDRIEPLPEYQDDRKTILFIGRLEKRKGTIWLLKAYQELIERYDNVRLVIAGDGHKRVMLEQYVETHNLPNVEFLGFVSEEQKLRLLKSCDIFCSPALYGESFGIVLLEAMAMGAVTVCGNNPGYASVMQGRGRLSLVDAKSTTDFAQRLELLLADEEVRELWLQWATHYVKQFNYPAVVDRYEKIYHELIENKD